MKGYWRVWCPVERRYVQSRVPSPAPLSAADTSTSAAVAAYWEHLRTHGQDRE